MRCRYRTCQEEAGEQGFCDLHWKVLPDRYKGDYAYPMVWLEDAVRAIRCIEMSFDLKDHPFDRVKAKAWW